jgi:hypothetical protein
MVWQLTQKFPVTSTCPQVIHVLSLPRKVPLVQLKPQRLSKVDESVVTHLIRHPPLNQRFQGMR